MFTETHKNKAPLISEAMLAMSLPPFFAYYGQIYIKQSPTR
jgi:hypothetical protein